jgi:hypothetical protein
MSGRIKLSTDTPVYATSDGAAKAGNYSPGNYSPATMRACNYAPNPACTAHPARNPATVR